MREKPCKPFVPHPYDIVNCAHVVLTVDILCRDISHVLGLLQLIYVALDMFKNVPRTLTILLSDELICMRLFVCVHTYRGW